MVHAGPAIHRNKCSKHVVCAIVVLLARVVLLEEGLRHLRVDLVDLASVGSK